MKLKQIAVKEPIVRTSISLKESTSDLIEAYRATYKKLYGNEIELSPFIETIIREYITSDRSFMRRQREAEEAEAAAAEAAAAEAAAAEVSGEVEDDEEDEVAETVLYDGDEVEDSSSSSSFNSYNNYSGS